VDRQRRTGGTTLPGTCSGSGAPDEPRPMLIDDGSDGSVVGAGVRVLDRHERQL
jgi:hypothetical protein